MLFTGYISFQWILKYVLLTLIHRTAIYTLDRVICPLTDWALVSSAICWLLANRKTSIEYKVQFKVLENSRRR